MKVWQCIVVSGLACVLAVAQAQETSTPPQNGSQAAEAQPSEAEQDSTNPQSAESAPSEQEAAQQQADNDSAPKQDWTPDALFEHVVGRAKEMAGS